MGYISTQWGKRDILKSLKDIETYWHWREWSLTKETGSMGLDGIFVDEVDCNGDFLEYFQRLYEDIKLKSWRRDEAGSALRVLLDLLTFDIGFVILNPGCAPRHPGYYDIADMVIVFEYFHYDFSFPPLEDPVYRHLCDVDSSHGMRLMLPESSEQSPASMFGVMVHDFLASQRQQSKLLHLKDLIYDLVRVKRLKALFVTDIEIQKLDVYANWSSFWEDFINIMAEANGIVDLESNGSTNIELITSI